MTVSALETLLFRARRSLAEELEHQLTCTEAQFAVSQAADGRLGRKERAPASRAPRGVSRLRSVRAGSEAPSAGAARPRAGPDTGLPHALPGLRGLGVCRDASGGRCRDCSCRRVRQRRGRRGRRHLRRRCGAQGRGGRHGCRCRGRGRGRRRHRDRVQGQEQASRQGREGREAARPDGSSRGARSGTRSRPREGERRRDRRRPTNPEPDSSNSSNARARGNSADAKARAPGQSVRTAKPAKKAAGLDRPSPRVTPSPNRVRPNLARERIRQKARRAAEVSA